MVYIYIHTRNCWCSNTCNDPSQDAMPLKGPALWGFVKLSGMFFDIEHIWPASVIYQLNHKQTTWIHFANRAVSWVYLSGFHFHMGIFSDCIYVSSPYHSRLLQIVSASLWSHLRIVPDFLRNSFQSSIMSWDLNRDGWEYVQGALGGGRCVLSRRCS